MEPITPEVVQTHQQRLDLIIQDPNTMDTVFANVANGGDLISFCQVRNVRYSDVAAWITSDKDRLAKYSAASTMGQEWLKLRVLKELHGIGTVDIRGILDKTGGLKDPAEWPDDIARAVAGITIDDLYEGFGKDRERIGYTKKIKLTDKVKVLELIGRELGMFVNRSKLEITTKLEDIVGGSFEESELTPPVPGVLENGEGGGDPH